MIKVFPDPDMDAVVLKISGIVEIDTGNWPVRMTKAQALAVAKVLLEQLKNEVEECPK